MESHLEKGKFYVPEPEEFHPGFEYEWCREIGDSPYNTPWTKKTFTKKDSYHELWLNTPAGRDSDCGTYHRVKHLDQSDIESLGWEYVSHDNANTDRWHDVHKKGDYQMISGGVNKGLVIKKVIIQPYDHTLEVNLFQGVIKNKSELKRLLKQLEI